MDGMAGLAGILGIKRMTRISRIKGKTNNPYLEPEPKCTLIIRKYFV